MLRSRVRPGTTFGLTETAARRTTLYRCFMRTSGVQFSCAVVRAVKQSISYVLG